MSFREKMKNGRHNVTQHNNIMSILVIALVIAVTNCTLLEMYILISLNVYNYLC